MVLGKVPNFLKVFPDIGLPAPASCPLPQPTRHPAQRVRSLAPKADLQRCRRTTIMVSIRAISDTMTLATTYAAAAKCWPRSHRTAALVRTSKTW